MNTSNETDTKSKAPTATGWYWYQDEHYGPAPVLLDWAGFVDRTDERVLSVAECVGEDQPLLGLSVAELPGDWLPIAEPKW